MVRITKELLKKRSEHNDGILHSLQEITLHQFNIERIEMLGTYCRHLRILYLQNNLIPKIENLQRLRELRYLNLALNNVSRIEGLGNCECLAKLDLTLNFVDIGTLRDSVEHLKGVPTLRDLILTGNPCTSFDGYRSFVIHSLPFLDRLDSIEITRSQRITAKQQFEHISRELEIEETRARADKKAIEDKKVRGEYDVDLSAHCPEARLQTYREEVEKKQKDEKEAEEAKKFGKPPDAIKEARKKMGEKAVEGPDGMLPRQRNLNRLDFEMEDEDGEGNMRILIEAPKFLDTSEIDVDIHPRWFQVIIRGKSLLLHLSEEVVADKSRVRRIMSTGWLELILPKLNPPKARKRQILSSESVLKKDSRETSSNFLELDDKPHDKLSVLRLDENIPPQAESDGSPEVRKDITDTVADALCSKIGFDMSELPPLD